MDRMKWLMMETIYPSCNWVQTFIWAKLSNTSLGTTQPKAPVVQFAPDIAYFHQITLQRGIRWPKFRLSKAIFMPLPLFVFWGCLSVHPSVCPPDRPLSRWLTIPQSISGGFQAFFENVFGKWPEILHADVYRPTSNLFRFQSESVDIPHFGAIWTQWNRSYLGFLAFFLNQYWLPISEVLRHAPGQSHCECCSYYSV